MSTEKKRLVVLISGRGSNMLALLKACINQHLHADVVAVISNKASAQGLVSAQQAAIAIAVVDHKQFASRDEFDKALLAEVNQYQPDFVILAGFMRILTPHFVSPLTGRLVNIHPSLLPKYPGLNTHQRAIDAGDTQAGATVHFVTEELDGGPAIIQVRVPILANDNEDSLADRVLQQEHSLYIEAVNLLCNGCVAFTTEGESVFNGQALPEQGLIYTPL